MVSIMLTMVVICTIPFAINTYNYVLIDDIHVIKYVK